jgi:hypothetical protein
MSTNKKRQAEDELEGAPDSKVVATSNDGEYATLFYHYASSLSSTRLELTGPVKEVLTCFAELINEKLRKQESLCDVIPPFLSKPEEGCKSCLLDVNKLIDHVNYRGTMTALRLLLQWMRDDRDAKGGEFSFTYKNITTSFAL